MWKPRIQWNPVNTATIGPKKIGRINEVAVRRGSTVIGFQWISLRQKRRGGGGSEGIRERKKGAPSFSLSRFSSPLLTSITKKIMYVCMYVCMHLLHFTITGSRHLGFKWRVVQCSSLVRLESSWMSWFESWQLVRVVKSLYNYLLGSKILQPQPPPQALCFSHCRGERETRVTSDEPQGTMGRYRLPSFARTFSSRESRLGTRQLQPVIHPM